MLPTWARISIGACAVALVALATVSVLTVVGSTFLSLECWRSGDGFNPGCFHVADNQPKDPRDQLITQAEADIRPQLPMKSPDGVTLESVTDANRNMFLKYEVPQPLAAQFESSGNEADRTKWMQQQSCQQKSIATLTSSGVTVHLSYSSAGTELASVVVGKRECATGAATDESSQH